jgi:hypothetical protein
MAQVGALNGASSDGMYDEDDDTSPGNTSGALLPFGGGDTVQAAGYESGAYSPVLNSFNRDALPLTAPGPYQPSQNLTDLNQTARGLLGMVTPGALNTYQTQEHAALAAKKQKINDAIDLLSRSGSNAPGAVNLPMLMAGSAMLQPSYGFAQSLGNAGAAAGQAIGQQRQIDRENAVAMGNLGIEGANVDVQGAQSDELFGTKILNASLMAEEQAAKGETYERSRYDALTGNYLRAKSADQARADALAEKKRNDDLVNQAKEDARNQGRYQWLAGEQSDPNDPTKTAKGMWRVPTRGDPNEPPKFFSGDVLTGRPSTGGQGAFQARFAIASKLYDDPEDAFQAAMGHKKVDPNAVWLAAAKQAAEDYRSMGGSAPSDPADAQQWIKDRTTFYRGVMVAPSANTAADPGFKTNFPLKPGTGSVQIPPGFNKAFPNAPAPATVQPPAQTPAPQGDNEAAILNQARDAISRGAPRGGVAARLKSLGVDPSKL